MNPKVKTTDFYKIEYYESSIPNDSQGNAVFCTLARYKPRGSLTVEAALTLPLILAVLLTFMQFFGAIVFQAKLQSAMENVGRRRSHYYYAVEEIKDEDERSLLSDLAEGVVFLVASETVIKGLVLEELQGARSPDGLIVNGKSGISFALSHYSPEDEIIYLTARYKIKIPFLEILRATVQVYQGTAHRIWTGRALPEAEEEQLVYVTENGTVYHTHLSCGSLSLGIKETTLKKVGQARNTSGGKYYPCEYCGDGTGDKVYITTYGDRYHFDRNCSRLKRSITSIPNSQVGDKTLCKRGAKKEQA